MALKAEVRMESPTKFRARGYLGGDVLIHHPHGGEAREGPGPMEMVLLGVGGCTAVDIVDILRKEREPVDSFHVDIEAERAPEPPTVFTRIHLHYVVSGPKSEANVRRAIDLSMERYCSASIMLKRGGVEVTTSFALVGR